MEKKKKNLGWKQFEHTASTILVIQTVTKNLKKGLFLFHTGALVVYKPHGYLWVQLFFVIFCYFLFPHKTGGVCKCASAIWTLSGVGLRKSCRRHKNMGQDPLTGLCVVVDPET